MDKFRYRVRARRAASCCSEILWGKVATEPPPTIRRSSAIASSSAATLTRHKLRSAGRRALGALGDALVRTGNVTEARKAWLAAERMPEPSESALDRMVRRDMEQAQRALKERNFVRAERLFRRVLAFAPEQAVASGGLAACLRKLGETREAEAWELRAGSRSAKKPRG